MWVLSAKFPRELSPHIVNLSMVVFVNGVRQLLKNTTFPWDSSDFFLSTPSVLKKMSFCCLNLNVSRQTNDIFFGTKVVLELQG